MGHQLSKYFTYVATYLEPPHHCKKAKIVKHSEINKNSFIRFLPSATKLRRLCFYTCLSVILFTGGGGLPQCMLGYHTPLNRHPPTQDQTPHRDQAAPRTMHPPPGTRHPHPRPGPGTPPRDQALPSRRLLLRTVRILLEWILVHPAV